MMSDKAIKDLNGDIKGRRRGVRDV